MKEKLLVFDMDGTLADLYGQENWLEGIRAKKTDPYETAQPLVDMVKLVDMLNRLHDTCEIAIVTWGSKDKDNDYLKEVRKAKKAWLDKYGFPYDRFHCVQHGYSKRYPVSPNKARNKDIPERQILFDDDMEVRNDWKKWDYHKAVSHDEMLDFISNLVREKEGYGNEMCFQPDLKDDSNLYLVLDCETATLPFINEWKLTPKQKQNISIAKPLIYDIAWQMINKAGKVRSRHSFLIQETFFVPQVFNTAYYSWKRPLYMERYEKGEIKSLMWEQAMCILLKDLEQSEYATAYNAMFDFKKAIPFTDTYMSKLYTAQYTDWEKDQRHSCKLILDGYKPSNPNFDQFYMELRGRAFPIADIWGMACERLINSKKYKLMCLENNMISASGLFFKTSAEASFRYLAGNVGFEEEHTALSDTKIESDILTKILKKGDIEPGIIYFPFRELGETVKFMIENQADITFQMYNNVVNMITAKLEEYEKEYRECAFSRQLESKMYALQEAFPDYCRKAFRIDI